MMNNHVVEKKNDNTKKSILTTTISIHSKIERNLSLDEPKTLHQDQLNAARVRFFFFLFIIALVVTFLSLYIYILYIILLIYYYDD